MLSQHKMYKMRMHRPTESIENVAILKLIMGQHLDANRLNEIAEDNMNSYIRCI